MTEHYIVSPLQQDTSHKFIIAVLMEYIRSLNQVQITVQVLLCRKADMSFVEALSEPILFFYALW